MTEHIEDGGSAREWTPQETVALIAPIFDLAMEDVQDVVIVAIDRQGQYYQSYAIEGIHQSVRERMCRLIYIHSILNVSVQMVNNKLHEEAHNNGQPFE